MPFKSQAQRRKFAELLVEGKISADTFEEWNRETGSKRLPEHVSRPARNSAEPIGGKRSAGGAKPRAGSRKRAAARKKR